MKVAICFWGLCRSTDYTIESLHNKIFRPLKANGIEYDTFIHTFTLYRPYTNHRANEHSIILKNTIWKLLEPTEHIVEHQDYIDTLLEFEKYRTHGNPWASDSYTFQTLDNHIRSLYSLKRVTELWKNQNTKYDAVMYVRPDVYFSKPIQIEWLKNLKDNTILLPNFQLYENCNDRFAIGLPDVASYFGNRFDEAYEYSLTNSLHSEKYLAHILKKNNIEIEHVPIAFRRIRADGLAHPGDMGL
jgi:hypothetical protein